MNVYEFVLHYPYEGDVSYKFLNDDTYTQEEFERIVIDCFVAVEPEIRKRRHELLETQNEDGFWDDAFKGGERLEAYVRGVVAEMKRRGFKMIVAPISMTFNAHSKAFYQEDEPQWHPIGESERKIIDALEQKFGKSAV